jgi:Sec-independent protein translocase protein TatA
MKRASPRVRQRGLSLIGVLFIGVIVVILLLLGAKLVPAVVEYIAIERAVQKIKNEGNTVGEIREAFQKHATIDDIKSISARDLDVTKEGDRVVISYAYTYNIPLMDNVRLVIDFSGTTRDRATKAGP